MAGSATQRPADLTGLALLVSVVDVVPHLAYGAVTTAVLERLDDD